MKRHDRLCIGMSLAPTWLAQEGWRAPDSGIEGLYTGELAVRIARASAHLDFLFRPDTTSLRVPALEQSFGFAGTDPTMQLAALARETRRIGLVTTTSTTFGHPYTIARQLMSLHWMSQGRAGWNVVTALQGHENYGLTEMPSSQTRYARAEEFIDAVHSLWRSFPARAVLADRAAGRYADTSLIQHADHHGAAFDIAGPLTLPAFPGPRIPIMQAGASAAGVALAGRMADMVFAQTLDKAAALAAATQLSQAAIAANRPANAVRLLPGLNLYLGQTRKDAQALFRETQRRVTREQRLARVREALGLDLTEWSANRRLLPEDLPPDFVPRGNAQHSALLQRLVHEDTPTVADLLSRPEVLSPVHWLIVGTPEKAAGIIADWFDSGAIDGFVAVPGGSTQSFDLTLGALVPLLRDEGLFRPRYSGNSLLHHLESG